MRTQDIFFLAFKALKDRKMRTGLTVLGIVIGSAMVVALVGSTSGLTASVTAQISKMGVTTLTVFPSSNRVQLGDKDVAALSALPGVQEVIPYYQKRLQINYGTTILQVTIYGIDQDRLPSLYKGLELNRGDYPSRYDPTGALIGSAIANPPEGNLQSVDVSELLLLQGASTSTARSPSYSFLVRGVLKPFGAVGFLNIDETVFMTTMGAQLVFKINYYSGLYVIASTPEDVTAVQTGIQEYYGADARIMSAKSMLETVQSITGQLTLFMGGVAVISLFVAGVGITNTMFVSVMERTREIGIMKAIGYRPKDILMMFLSEASINGLLGGILGTITGTFLSFFLGGGMPNMRMPGAHGPGAGFQPVITTQLLMFSIFFPIIISIVAGMYPAWRGSRLNTVTALKYE